MSLQSKFNLASSLKQLTDSAAFLEVTNLANTAKQVKSSSVKTLAKKE
jgi:hypothetical protein